MAQVLAKSIKLAQQSSKLGRYRNTISLHWGRVSRHPWPHALVRKVVQAVPQTSRGRSARVPRVRNQSCLFIDSRVQFLSGVALLIRSSRQLVEIHLPLGQEAHDVNRVCDLSMPPEFFCC